MLLVTGRLLRGRSALKRLPMRLRDPRDRRYPERLAASSLASLLIHALLAALLFTVLVSSSEEGANENVAGGEIVTLSRSSPVAVANQPAQARAVEPVPNVPVVAPPRHAPPVLPQAQRQQVNHHELAKTAPSAPPNPLPIPQRTPQPQPAPTENTVETHPAAQLPAAPVTVPTVGPVAVSVKVPADRRAIACTFTRAGRARNAAAAPT